MKNPLFYAKILLFGEYGIIENSKGLTLPFNFYKGIFKFSENIKVEGTLSNQHLKSFASYLQTIELPDNYRLNVDDFQKDIANGMYFDSNIPQGYGVGSSGALVAAIFNRYNVNNYTSESISKKQIQEIKNVFGLMESYFHGQSSGIDPLICFMNLPLLIESKTQIDTIGVPKFHDGKGAIFLINSGIPSETGPMVQIFFEKLKKRGFRKTLKEEFIKYNDACIDAFLKKDFQPLFSNLKQLSQWVLINFQPMIPQGLLKVWEQGIKTDTYYLKLCGSGGGGYVLGFTLDYETTEKMLNKFEKEIIYRF